MDNVIHDELENAMAQFENPKFMCTKDENEEPNIALVMTWTVYDQDALVYGDFMTYKTKNNLEAGNNKLGLCVLTQDLENWMIKADFKGYHRNDDVYEFMAMTPLFRYNQYTNARAAGLAHAFWASEKYSQSKIGVLSSYVKARLSARKVPQKPSEEGNMPRNVKDRMDKMTAVKVVCYIDKDGYPSAFPAFGMASASENRIVLDRGPEIDRNADLVDGQRVAISLVTLEPAAFQLKGTFRELDTKSAYVELDRVYTCSLPRPGLRVDIPLLERL
ncbi:hypothetical protein EU537_08510 [Candidatus Thorarchaeota archaeon]|nr:MAG: hypothetical protein EU537_08510 [Candidatus Thorarchaeota archaeon]